MSVTVRMNRDYQSDIGRLRDELERNPGGHVEVRFYPSSADESVTLLLRGSDAYIVGFCNASGHWFYLKGDTPPNAPKTSTELRCGGSYMELPDVTKANRDGLKGVLEVFRAAARTSAC